MVTANSKLYVRGGTAEQYDGGHCVLLAFWKAEGAPGPPDLLYRARTEFESTETASEYYELVIGPRLQTLAATDAVYLDDLEALLAGFERIDPASISLLTS